MPKEIDFINNYVRYADVIEAPPEAHEAVATAILAAVLNKNVYIKNGSQRVPLDLWTLLLSPSGFGRNTLVDLARPLLDKSGLSKLVRSTTWGSRQAFYQEIAEHPVGLYVWPELSAVLKKLADRSFGGVKEWLTDRYDSWQTPDTIGYRKTGKKSDTPPIVFDCAPRLNILATSSFDWFTNNLATEDATGGFVPRWTIFRSSGTSKLVPKPMEPDVALLDPLAERLHAASNLEGAVDLSAIDERYAAWYGSTKTRFSEQPNSGLALPFFNRHRIHMLKLAAVYEVSSSGTLKLSTESMQRAERTARKLEQTIFELLQTGFNPEGAELKKMLDYVRSAGALGRSQSEITRAFQYIRPQDRSWRIRTLLDARDLVCFTRTTAGRTAFLFVHRDYAERHQEEFRDDKPM